ncbi:hypothetical protein MMC25_002571 [Agyrium rufum]|nr:hypothetical protein [Agyrium rufum]
MSPSKIETSSAELHHHDNGASSSVTNAGAAATTGKAVKVKVESPTIRGRPRKRNSEIAGLDNISPKSEDDEDEREGTRIGVKRACNECRQQKLRCNVVQDPFQPCTRCVRCSLDCRIDSNFKRIGKRVRNAQMEQELAELRKQLASQGSSPTAPQQPSPFSNSMRQSTMSPSVPQIAHTVDQYMGSEEAVASLLDLKSGLEGRALNRSPNGSGRLRRLENIYLMDDRVQDLFHHYFTYYHPFIPFLDPEKSPDAYYDASPLLFWSLISVAARRYAADRSLLGKLAEPVSRLLWSTLATVPQDYQVVKALCVLCSWPLPITTTSSDPTFMLSGIMMMIAMQIGLHRPSHSQDFSKFRVELREEELRDRVKTWAAANVMAERCATSYGQPPSTHYDWTLVDFGAKDDGFRLSVEAEARLLIERFSHKVTETLYSNPSDPVGLVDDQSRIIMTKLLVQDLAEVREAIRSRSQISTMNELYLEASTLHLRLSVLFASPNSPDYRHHLMDLWHATTAFLKSAFKIHSPESSNLIAYATNYILHMMIASGFVLLKLLNSSFASLINLDNGKELFVTTVKTIRNISITNADLPWRLAEVLAQLWKGGGAGSAIPTSAPQDLAHEASLQLKVRCRMSMSLVYDSVWRWREEFLAKGRGNLDSATKNPTNPDSSAPTSSTASSDIDGALPSISNPHLSHLHRATSSQPPAHNHTITSFGHLAPPPPASVSNTPLMFGAQGASTTLGSLGASATASAAGGGSTNGNFGGLGGGGVTPGPDNSFGEANYEVFDPLNWIMDGLVEFPYDGSGMGGLDGF